MLKKREKKEAATQKHKILELEAEVEAHTEKEENWSLSQRKKESKKQRDLTFVFLCP